MLFLLFCLLLFLLMCPEVAIFIGVAAIALLLFIWIFGFYSLRKDGYYESIGKERPKWYEIWKLP